MALDRLIEIFLGRLEERRDRSHRPSAAARLIEIQVQYKNCGTEKLWEFYVYFVESMLIYIHNISTTRPQTIYSHTLSYFKLLMFSWNYFDLPLHHFNYSPTNRLLPQNIWFQTSISSYNGSSPSLCERGRKRETSGWLPWSYDGHENRAPYLQWQNRAPCFQDTLGTMTL